MTRSEITAMLDRRCDAVHAKNLDRLMALYAADIVYFDVVPPLRYVGATMLQERFSHWFDRWKTPIGQEILDVIVASSGDIATAHMLIRASGTLTNGRAVNYWVRATNSFRRSAGGWLITHEHVSLPGNLENGTVVMDLVP